MSDIVGRLPTIPEYYRLYINKSVDLTLTPKQPCPFHQETTPSWSYSAEHNKWRCFGGCKCGGDVIDLHKVNYKLSSRSEAEKSLRNLHKCVLKPTITVDNSALIVRESKVKFETLYQRALILANSPARWLELDYVMSKYPVDVFELRELLEKWE